MKLSREQLRQIADALPAPEGKFAPRFALASAPRDGLRLDRLEGPTLPRWLDAEIERVEGADRKLAAAYMMGRLSWSLAIPLSGLALSNAWIGDAKPGATAFRIRHVPWESDGETGIAPVADLWLDPSRLRFEALDDVDGIPAFRTAFEAILTPLVEAMNAYSALPRSALWRLAGDSLSAGFLAAGKQLGCAERAMSAALPMLREKGTPLFSRQTGFVEIHIPERPDVSEWFRARGGCCRYYTTEGGEYCTTCVLRDAESRDQRLIDYLRRTHVDEAA